VGARFSLACVIVMLGAASAAAQSTGPPSWSWSAAAFTYVIPGDDNYVQPTVAADRRWLHLEARYNYEAIDATSLWFGYNLDGGDTVAWTLTPMLGGAFGSITGVAPGYAASLTWWKVDAYSEGEYLADLTETADSFLYNWSEISLAAAEWLRVGVVTQRTRVRDSAGDLQRGPLLGLAFRNVELTAYLLDDGDSAPTVVLSAGWRFGAE
jgi:hypothetical protein